MVREDQVRTPGGGGGHLQAKERGLRRKPTLLTPWSQALSPRNGTYVNFCGLFAPRRLWYFAMADLVN